MTEFPMLRLSALRHAARGFRVMPLYGLSVDALGRCVCRCPVGADCPSPGKHPRISGWVEAATTDPERIRRWWGRWPDANVGAATGRGWLVIDVDPRNGGAEALGDLEATYGPLPVTVRALTGSGGQHIYLRYDEPDLTNRHASELLGFGVDIRADGGQVVLPGSLHHTGRRYHWAADCHPDDQPIAPAPAWLLGLLRSRPPARPTGQERLDVAAVLNGVQEGQRDHQLFRLAARLRRADVPRAWAERLVIEAASRCRPPFPIEQALAKVASAYRYRPWAPSPPPASAD